jgi:hypothetical protein
MRRDAPREFTVNVHMTFEYVGVITLRARSQEEGDARALAEFEERADQAGRRRLRRPRRRVRAGAIHQARLRVHLSRLPPMLR